MFKELEGTSLVSDITTETKEVAQENEQQKEEKEIENKLKEEVKEQKGHNEEGLVRNVKLENEKKVEKVEQKKEKNIVIQQK